jgi:hypothetical protein
MNGEAPDELTFLQTSDKRVGVAAVAIA